MTTPSTYSQLIDTWQGVKRARSGDRFFVLTDTQTHYSAMYGCSTVQQWFRVGAVDLRTMKLGYVDFSIDDIRALLRSKVSPAPWKQPHAVGIELTRLYHGPKKQGRFRERVTLIDLDPVLLAQGPRLRAYFERHLYFTGNSSAGMWTELEQRAAELRAIEEAALSMTDWFAARDVKAQAGNDVSVTRVLKMLVAEGRLVPNGKKKGGARYMVAMPACIQRADWVG